MFDLSNLFISAAYAADSAAPAAEMSLMGDSGGWMRFLPLFLIFIVFYFLLIRPQQKQLEAQNAVLKALKKGDKVVTGGGIVGTIVKVEGEAHLVVEIAKDVQVKVLRNTVTGLASEPKPAENK